MTLILLNDGLCVFALVYDDLGERAVARLVHPELLNLLQAAEDQLRK